MKSPGWLPLLLCGSLAVACEGFFMRDRNPLGLVSADEEESDQTRHDNINFAGIDQVLEGLTGAVASFNQQQQQQYLAKKAIDERLQQQAIEYPFTYMMQVTEASLPENPLPPLSQMFVLPDAASSTAADLLPPECLEPPSILTVCSEVARRRYFYNTSSGLCERFYWRGCEDSRNRFESALTCVRACSADGTPPVMRQAVRRHYHDDGSQLAQRLDEEQPPSRRVASPKIRIIPSSNSICNQNIDSGPCHSYVPMYAYDAGTGQCTTFIWGGCLGSKNRFVALEHCREQCIFGGVTQPPASTPPVALGSIVNLCFGPTYPETAGRQCAANMAISMFHYNRWAGRCERFTYTGCAQVPNMFTSAIDCMRTCQIAIPSHGTPSLSTVSPYLSQDPPMFQNGCPPGVRIVTCVVNPCDVSFCTAFPTAICQPDYCGGCTANFFAGGSEVDCSAPSDSATTQSSVTTNSSSSGPCPMGIEAVPCLYDPCALTPCPNFPKAACRTNNCGGCFAEFYNEITGSMLSCFKPPSSMKEVEAVSVHPPPSTSTKSTSMFTTASTVTAVSSTTTSAPSNGSVSASGVPLFIPPSRMMLCNKTVECLIDPCLFASCPAFSTAECRPNVCHGCMAEFYVDNRRINCSASWELPKPGVCPAIHLTYNNAWQEYTAHCGEIIPNLCTSDGECPLSKKCCPGICGYKVCEWPMLHVEIPRNRHYHHQGVQSRSSSISSIPFVDSAAFIRRRSVGSQVSIFGG